AVAPSGATGLAGSLMRRHRRLLQERSLTRQFLSASETANQVSLTHTENVHTNAISAHTQPDCPCQANTLSPDVLTYETRTRLEK
ncbi:hypothetical protein GBF38_006925, partial [Nibea albiflora]